MRPKSVCLLLITAFICLGFTVVGEESPSSGIFTYVQGEVLFKRNVETDWDQASFDMPIYRGYKVKVSLYSRAEITLRDRSVIRLKEGTQIDTSELLPVGAGDQTLSSVKLILGQVWAKVKKLEKGTTNFEITTPTVVASVSGTSYRVNYEQSGSTQIKVYDGEVSVFKPAPLGTASAPGAISKPSKVARPTEKIQRPVRQVSKAEWERLVGAMQQITISADGSFSEPEDFNPTDPDEQDEWVKWNRERDALLDK